jgi:TP901 family phage tail tape measure protein
MPKKALASLNVVINAVTSPLFRGLNKASKRLTRFGGQMKAIGRSITTSFSLPFAAISVAGAKMAIDFQKNMTKINTLVGISSKEVNELSKDVMRLSGETAQAPEQLAEGLFFLTSAGLRGANAMETLEAVSKATAIGLGEQSDLAKVAAAAQNAYGKANLSAAKALDIFGGAVREGMFEAKDLAEVLGTQLGMAASLGISFEEVNAFIATYTKTTGDAKSATTSFGGVMMALAKTTPQMERALNKVGMTGDSVRQMLGERGLRATLISIKDAFEENNVPLTQFFSKSQALKGVLGVLGNQTKTYGNVLDGLHTSVGMVDEGFDTFSETAGFKMQQAFQNLKNAAAELGAIVMPLFTKLAEFGTKIAKGFTELDRSTKALVVGAAALLAFSGPLMTLAGGLVTALGAILTPTGLVVVAIGAIFTVIYNNWPQTKKIFVDFINYFIDLYNEVELFRVAVAGISTSFKILWATVKYSLGNIWATLKTLGANTVELFSGVGNIIKGAFTQGIEGAVIMGKGIMQVMEGMEKDIEDTLGDNARFVQYGKDIADAVSDGAAMLREKAEFITEDDIQNNVDNIEEWFKNKLSIVRKKLEGALGGGGLAVPTGGKGDDGGSGGGDDGGNSELNKTLEGKKTLWENFYNWLKNTNKNGLEGLAKGLQKFAQTTGQILNAIGGMWAAQSQKENRLLENEQKLANEALEKEFEREARKVAGSNQSAQQRSEAMIRIRENFDAKQAALDKKMDAKKLAIQRKQAQREKKIQIATAIMNTAAAIASALPNIFLAALVGTMGAVQIATIASTPLPLAKGGLAFGPTNAIVGDNPNAANDPEVIAPLSKLKQMLGGEMDVSLNVGGVLKGTDIYLSNDITTEKRERYI